MATDPVRDHVFYVANMQELQTLLQGIGESSCKSKSKIQGEVMCEDSFAQYKPCIVKKKGSALCLPIICLADSQRKSWLGLKRQQKNPIKSKSEQHEQANAQTESETTSVLTCPCLLRCQTNLESNHYLHRNWLQCACGILSLSDCDVNWIKV